MQENKNTNNKSIVINAQYIKDLSFENPSSPESLIKQQQPSISMALDVNALAVNKSNTYEVILRVQIEAKHDDQPIFLIDLQYAGLFTISIADKDELALVLQVHCSQLMFPYVRRIISDITRDAGYVPLMLTPVDFYHIYQDRNAQNRDMQ